MEGGVLPRLHKVCDLVDCGSLCADFLNTEMPLHVDRQLAEANSRLALIKLSTCTLRLMSDWRRDLAGFDEAMILLAIVAVSSDKLTRADLDEELRDLATPMPHGRLARTNLSSIARATGLNRETVRRKVGRLVDQGLVVRSGRGAVRIAPAATQRLRVRELALKQLEHLRRTANQLLHDRILEFRH
jgi:hypothetical protein